MTRPFIVIGRLARPAVVLALLGAGGGCAHPSGTPPPPSAVPPTKPDVERAVQTGIPMASTPQGLMREGAEKKIQLKLKAEGLLAAEECNGQLDPPTREALRKFQKSQGIPPTGLPSYETITHLELDPDTIFHTIARPQDPTKSPTEDPGRKPTGTAPAEKNAPR